MGAMSAMDSKDDEKPKKGLDLAIIMGKPKGGGDKMPGMEAKPESDDLPAGFEEAFSEAFPDAAGDKDRMMALKRLIGLCSDSDDY